MTKKRKKYSSQFKFKVAPEAVKGLQTINEIASQNGVHPSLVSTWKKRLLEETQRFSARTQLVRPNSTSKSGESSWS